MTHQRAVLAYASQFPKKIPRRGKVHIPLDGLLRQMNSVSRFYGEMAGVEHAEPFVIKEVMQVEDVVKLPVRVW